MKGDRIKMNVVNELTDNAQYLGTSIVCVFLCLGLYWF